MATLSLKASHKEQRSVFRFLWGKGYNANAIQPETRPVYGDKCFTRTAMLGVRNLHLTMKCNQLFISGLDRSQHRFLRQALTNFLTDGINVYMNLDDTLKNETLMFDV